jgi:hypothetical protein
VIVSCTPPTRMSASTAMTAEPLTWSASRFTVANPDSVKVTVYSPGRRSSMRYGPVPSVTAVANLFDQRRARRLDGDAGKHGPDASLTTPAIVPCANAAPTGRTRGRQSTRPIRTKTRMLMTSLDPYRHPYRNAAYRPLKRQNGTRPEGHVPFR